MCGRFQMDPQALYAIKRNAKIPSFIEVPLGLIYPSRPALILQKGRNELEGDIRTFGWNWKDKKKRLINARAETVLEKPMFSNGIRKHRCIIPASRFFEWDDQKTMIGFEEKDSPILYMAGILQSEDFIILTTQANKSMHPYHSRMPLILKEDQLATWIWDDSRTEQLLHTIPPQLTNDAPLRLF